MGQVATGHDPVEERRMLLRSETVEQLADLYMRAAVLNAIESQSHAISGIF
jgi:hypothetical protein